MPISGCQFYQAFPLNKILCTSSLSPVFFVGLTTTITVQWDSSYTSMCVFKMFLYIIVITTDLIMPLCNLQNNTLALS